jgi:ABC-type sulfate transport system permease subunit
MEKLMKNKMMRVLIQIGLSLLISAISGYLCTLLIPYLQPGAFNLVQSTIKNEQFQPVSLFILLSLIPMLVSFLVGFILAWVLRVKPQGVTQ